jgi:hypothetical protein
VNTEPHWKRFTVGTFPAKARSSKCPRRKTLSYIESGVAGTAIREAPVIRATPADRVALSVRIIARLVPAMPRMRSPCLTVAIMRPWSPANPSVGGGQII